MEVPNVKRDEYQLIDVNADDGNMSLLLDNGDTKDDLNLPRTTDGQYEDVAKECIQMFDDGKAITCTVIAAVGEEKLIAVREMAG
jgi:translation initiation factor 5A